MPAGLTDHFALYEEGGNQRNAGEIFSHLMRGASDEKLLQNAVTLSATARKRNGKIVVKVKVTNDKTGHHVPTDSPLRHMILLVQATDRQGQTLILLEGETLPEWCGVGNPENGYYARLPGKAYAKILQELWTEVSPTGAYWNHTRVLSDNRLAAFATDTGNYMFAAPDKKGVTIEITLLFRRAFISLMHQKGWNVPDVVMARRTLRMR